MLSWCTQGGSYMKTFVDTIIFFFFQFTINIQAFQGWLMKLSESDIITFIQLFFYKISRRRLFYFKKKYFKVIF